MGNIIEAFVAFDTLEVAALSVPFQVRYSTRNAAFGLLERRRIAVALAAGKLEGHAPEPQLLVGIYSKDSADVLIAVEHVEVVVVPVTAFAGDVGAAKDELHCSNPALRDQPAALVRRNLVLLDRLGNRGLLVGSINEADELGWRAADMVDGPGMDLLLGRLFGHEGLGFPLPRCIANAI
jgi:hypothetical protein